MERLASQLWQKSKEFKNTWVSWKILCLFSGEKIKGVLRELVQVLEQKLREVRMQSAIKQAIEGLGTYTSFSMQGNTEI